MRDTITNRASGRSINLVNPNKIIQLIKYVTCESELLFKPSIALGNTNPVHGSFTSVDGKSRSIKSQAHLLQILENDNTESIFISHSKTGEDYFSLTFAYYPADQHGSLDITFSENLEETCDDLCEHFKKILPKDNENDLDIRLKQSGFNFESENHEYITNYRKYKSRTERQNLKKELGESEYGRFFERYLDTLIDNEMSLQTLMNVQIKDEGLGGDYDVLALYPGEEIIYLEAKTGRNLTKARSNSIFERIKVLTPTFTIIVFDLSGVATKAKSKILYESMVKTLKLKYQIQREIISDSGGTYIESFDRKIFVISGDDIIRNIRKCVRFYDTNNKKAEYLLLS